MGFLDKAKNIETASTVSNDITIKPRFSSFMFAFSSFLENIGAEYGAFLIKRGGVFYVACPIGLDTQTFNETSFDASVIMSECSDTAKEYDAPFIVFADSNEEHFSTEVSSLLSSAVLYPMDKSNCVFLLWRFEDTFTSPIKTGKKDKLISALENFQKEYQENEVMVATCLPPFPKYVGSSSIESKLQGSNVASTKLNFITFSFDEVFNLSQVEEDVDSLVTLYSLVNRICLLVGKSNFAVLQKDFVLNTCIFSAQLLDENVYKVTIKSVLSSIYASSLVDKVKITFKKGIENAKDEVLSWLENIYTPFAS